MTQMRFRHVSRDHPAAHRESTVALPRNARSSKCCERDCRMRPSAESATRPRLARSLSTSSWVGRASMASSRWMLVDRSETELSRELVTDKARLPCCAAGERGASTGEAARASPGQPAAPCRHGWGWSSSRSGSLWRDAASPSSADGRGRESASFAKSRSLCAFTADPARAITNSTAVTQKRAEIIFRSGRLKIDKIRIKKKNTLLHIVILTSLK